MLHYAATALLLAKAALGATGGTFNPNFYANSWTAKCASGTSQSPVALPHSYGATHLDNKLAIKHIQFPSVDDVEVVNTGHALKITWANISADTAGAVPQLPAGGNEITAVLKDPSIDVDRTLTVTPVQFHFHSVSEHTVEGLYYPLEAHIVTLVSEGQAPEWGCDEVWQGGAVNYEKCAAVFGILYKLGESTTVRQVTQTTTTSSSSGGHRRLTATATSSKNQADKKTPWWLTMWIDEAPAVAGDYVHSTIHHFSLNDLLPANHDYYTYAGSLTTPGCYEGVRWHVFKEPRYISPEDMAAIQTWTANTKASSTTNAAITTYRDNHRSSQPLYGRTIYFHSGAQQAKVLSAVMAVLLLLVLPF